MAENDQGKSAAELAAWERKLAEYLAVQDRKRREAVGRVLATLRPYERRLLREAAVMGYARGTLLPAGDKVPPDSRVLFDVVDACIDYPDRFPFLADAARGRRRRVVRLWPGEQPARPRRADSDGRYGGRQTDTSTGETMSEQQFSEQDRAVDQDGEQDQVAGAPADDEQEAAVDAQAAQAEPDAPAETEPLTGE